MIISDDLSYADAFGALQEVEADLGRPVNPNILALSEWRRKRAEESHFVEEVSSQPKIFIMGTEDGLELN